MVLDLEHFTICREKGGDSVKPLFPGCLRVYVEWAVARLGDKVVFAFGKLVAETGRGSTRRKRGEEARA